MIKDPIDFSLCRDCACAGARRASRELTRAFDDALRETGVRVTQFNLLATLILAGPTAATRLAALLRLERTTLTRNLRPLLRDGLVRFDGDRDRRVRKIAITAKGEETARAAFPFWKRAQDAAQARAAGLATYFGLSLLALIGVSTRIIRSARDVRYALKRRADRRRGDRRRVPVARARGNRRAGGSQSPLPSPLWFSLVLMVGETGLIGPERLGAPGLGAAVVAPAAVLAALFAFLPAVRGATLSISLPALVAVHAIRVLGVIFVALYAQGRLPAPFAPTAGWGDIGVGVAALPVAALIARFGSRVRPLALLWNIVGFADLVDAIALGALSAPGPLQVFAGPPTSALMTTEPWLIIPAFLVPCLLFIHLVIFARLVKIEARTASRPVARCRCDDANLSGGIAEALPQELRLHRLEKRGVTRYARYVTALLFHYRGALQGAVRHTSVAVIPFYPSGRYIRVHRRSNSWRKWTMMPCSPACATNCSPRLSAMCSINWDGGGSFCRRPSDRFGQA